MVKDAHHRIEKRHQQRESHQRLHAARAQNKVIDLQHVHRPCEHQQIGKGRKNAHGPIEIAAALAHMAQLLTPASHYIIAHLTQSTPSYISEATLFDP